MEKVRKVVREELAARDRLQRKATQRSVKRALFDAVYRQDDFLEVLKKEEGKSPKQQILKKLFFKLFRGKG